ncbi:hypothetical protein Tco_0625311 [Tanacetum coccineum]|uniref:Uncharacterized protein n=1 Tax=Tanacetum coccineum TaxID=301880 RepID=A0ABQ4WGF0_9ASTR
MSTPSYAQLVDKDTKSEPEEAPLEAEELTDSSHSSASLNSTTPLSPEHPLTHASPTPTPTRALFHCRTARMTVRALPAMSLGHSTRVAEAMALSNSAFCKRYKTSYETPSPTVTLPVLKKYRGTSELILNTDSKEDELGDKDIEEDESSDTNDERDKSEDKSLGL